MRHNIQRLATCLFLGLLSLIPFHLMCVMLFPPLLDPPRLWPLSPQGRHPQALRDPEQWVSRAGETGGRSGRGPCLHLCSHKSGDAEARGYRKGCYFTPLFLCTPFRLFVTICTCSLDIICNEANLDDKFPP